MDAPRHYRVVVADDDPDVRLLARRYLERSRRFTVVGEAADGEGAVSVTREHRPDLTLLDLVMPDADGLAVLPRIRASVPDTTVVVLSGLTKPRLSEDVVAAGALGMLAKQPSWARLVSSLVALLDGAESHGFRGHTDERSGYLHLPASLKSGYTARTFLRQVLREWGAGALLEDAELLTSELVNNAVVHATSDVEMHVSYRAGRLRVQVRDTGQGALHRRDPSLKADNGRGLFLVDAFACSWGTSAGTHGKTVWFELQGERSAVDDAPLVRQAVD